MYAEIYDANGNKASECAICARCGQSIKHVFEHDGKTYGSECIQIVTGLKEREMIFRNNVLDLDASLKARDERERKIEEQAAILRAQRQEWEETRARNKVHYKELCDVLRSQSKYHGDFCSNIASSIENATSRELDDILSPRAISIVADIYAKAVSESRRYSKKYDAAYDSFYDTYLPEVE